MRLMPIRLGLAAILLCLAVAAVIVVRGNLPNARMTAIPATPSNALYVWQHQWSPALVSAIQEASSTAGVFMVLGAEFTLENGQQRGRLPNVDWRVFAAMTQPTWVVLRVHELPDVRNEEERTASVEILAKVTRQLLDDMADSHARAAGVQIDYDCATENLIHYSSLLRLFRERLPNAAVSITTLPAWFGQPEFSDLLVGLDHYVLQVHSLEKPTNAEDPTTLCDTARVPGWLQQAESLGVPFYLALPTYGYRLSFGPGGEFVGLSAEESQGLWEGCTTRDIMADPVAIAGLVRTLRAQPPSAMLGLAWFRLPVAGDRLNWSWPLLEKVIAGHAPEPELRAEVRSPSENLYEVWVINAGQFPATEPIRVAVDWSSAFEVAHDAVGGFEFSVTSADAGSLVGKGPAPGEENLAAWFRLAPATGKQASTFRAGEVEILR